jgi:hypothetical protein
VSAVMVLAPRFAAMTMLPSRERPPGPAATAARCRAPGPPASG